jgi:Second Messenger Oligonucleotide or Dinucleotide Synthetase domain/Adenylyl/Guanylyl and SMODS C-terminal sensor domain
MKHIETFKYFLKETVNLNKTRVDVAENSISTITNLLKNNSLFGPKFLSTTPQGSFRQKTIIKPADPEIDFDVDILFGMKTVAGWSAKDYLEKLAGEFRKYERYKGKVDTRGKTRCVTIDYESDFHVDIIPCILQDGSPVIMNKKTDSYEQTDGDGYAEWFKSQADLTGGQHLVEVTRLIKYIRDYRADFEIKSVLLTTILGKLVIDSDSVATNYPDLPTSFKTIFNRLNDFLYANPDMPEVCNPVLPGENFNRNWDQEKYSKFRERVAYYNEKVNGAFDEEDEAKSLTLWQEIFGEEFSLPAQEDRESAKAEQEYPIDRVDHQRPVTDIAVAEMLTYEVSIEASLHNKIGRIKLQRLKSGAMIKAGFLIKFEAKTNAQPPFEVKWQVVNTGGHAASINNGGGLRGEFFDSKDRQSAYKSDSSLINWENTEYTGKHWVECFIVKDGICIARSRPFFINVTNPNKTWWRR